MKLKFAIKAEGIVVTTGTAHTELITKMVIKLLMDISIGFPTFDS